MDIQHTAEPWMHEANGDKTKISAWDRAGSQIVAYCYAEFDPAHGHSIQGCNQTKSVAEANARRIVACVNACAGLNANDLDHIQRTGGIKAMMDRAVLNAAQDAFAAEQRDKLLEAAAKVVKFADSEPDGGVTVEMHRANVERLRALIKEIES